MKMTTFSIVTGASSGIGLEMARQLAARSHNLILVSRNHEKLQQAASAIRQGFPKTVIHTLAVDLATPDAPKRVVEFTQELGVEVDVLINNAGVGLYGDHLEMDLEKLTSMLELNINALCKLCLFFGQQMKLRGNGHILNISSTAAYQPTPYFAAYGASKTFVLNFSEAFAKELEDFGVTVSCVSPGPTDTAFFGEMDQRGVETDHFDKRERDTALHVATIAIEAMFSGRLSRIVGTKNFWRAWATRLIPRTLAANYAKALMRSPHRRSESSRPQLTGH